MIIVTDEMFNSLKSSLLFYSKDTEKQLVICLSEITYSCAKMETTLKKGNLKKRLTDEMIDGSI